MEKIFHFIKIEACWRRSSLPHKTELEENYTGSISRVYFKTGKSNLSDLRKHKQRWVLEKNRMHQEKKTAGTQVSSEKPKTPAVIVPSQVRLEQPSHSSSSQDRFISKGLSEVEAELQDFDCFFGKLLGLMLEGESDSVAVSSTPRSYSPAVEVSDSDDEKGDQ